MKQKGLVVCLVLAAAGLTVWSAAAVRQQGDAGDMEARPFASPGADSPQAAPGSPGAARDPGADGTSLAGGRAVTPAGPAERAASPGPTAAESEGEVVALPQDLKVTVRETAAGRSLRVARQGHLVAVRSGAWRQIGMHEVNIPVDGDASLVWESTAPKTLETLRGRLSVGVDGAVSMEDTVRAAVVGEDARTAHRCQGHADGAGGFVVLCRVGAAAAAASVDGSEPREGVWSLAGDSTLVRFDLPMSGDGTSSRVLGYEKAGVGVLVRAEASRAPGESAAVLALGSGARPQPEPVRPVRMCHMPFHGDPRVSF